MISSPHGDVSTYFAPFDDLSAVLLDAVRHANKSIRILDYGFTLSLLVDDLCAAHRGGVDVYLILDHTQAHGHAEQAQLDRLTQAGVPWIEGTSPDQHQILHSKYAVIDAETVLYGSYNFTESAGLQSNTLSVSKGRRYAAGFLAHWYRIFAYVASAEIDMQPAGHQAIVAPTPEATVEAEPVAA